MRVKERARFPPLGIAGRLRVLRTCAVQGNHVEDVSEDGLVHGHLLAFDPREISDLVVLYR